MAAAASSSAASITPPRGKYDVFLSFRGNDTRDTFTSHLHAALLQKKIGTYRNDVVERGEQIAPALLKAIEESKLSVIIFSENYASSTWCLEEVVHILECKKIYGQTVVPIYYRIDPSDVRNQKGSYALPFRQFTERFEDNMDKVWRWRAALTEAANLSGFHYSSETGTEADIVARVVEHILSILKRELSTNLKGLVAIESHINQIESLLWSDGSPDVCSVGIWGMGGIGKTTLAEAVFHRFSSKFEACCLLKNVRDESEQLHGLDHLEKTLLSDILKEENSSIGYTFDRERLSRTRVLIVFDDVSDSSQIERLAADHLQYGPGSRIIITTRDRSTLLAFLKDDKIYELKTLTHVDALKLFYSHAFKDKSPRTDCKELAEIVVHYAGGIPFALKLLGSSFLHCKSKEEWEDKWNKLKRFPIKKIHEVFRASYNGLGTYEKEIFLDIACFHKDQNLDDVKRMFDINGFSAADAISILIEKSLISISERGSIEVHNLLQEMARTIVREEPRKHRILFTAKDKKVPSVEWVFLFIALCLEILSLACDRVSSPSKPLYALFGMLLAVVALLTGFAELVYKGKRERVKWRRWWFYYPNPPLRPFGTLVEIYGLIGGISQCICSTVQYVFFIRHAESPIKASLGPAIFLICLGASKLYKNRNQTIDEHED